MGSCVYTKEYEGLGIKDLEIFNRALERKWV